jgi:hydrogenase maturation protein HypF
VRLLAIKVEYKRYFLKAQGIVQGVGFRPYVYNQADFYHIKGWVSNCGSSLVIDFEGERNNIKNFLIKIIKQPPVLSDIQSVEIITKRYLGYESFQIIESTEGNDEAKFLAYDTATCPECIKDTLDPLNSRYKYVFTNCTTCGPRYSIINGLPYDRINTNMNKFEMCPECKREYLDQTNRRFHAQTNCCPTCGPSLKLINSSCEELMSEDPIKECVNLINKGKIVAIKGIGGFHLSCSAEDEQVIELLRMKKKRPHKPFAVMVKDIESARKLAFINEEEETALSSNKRPILILNKKEPFKLPKNIAPNTNRIGIMLPYTPLHHLLFQHDISYLIMTSGNLSGSSIEYINDKAIANLKNIADYFLIHNRDINTPVEDSVVRVENGHEIIIRSARGYTPFTIHMGVKNNIIALGSRLKNTFCISQDGYAYMSQYLNDLDDFDTLCNYEKAINNMTELIRFKPNVVAYDLHYDIQNTLLQKYINCTNVPVQHHHAHMASCMVEHNLYEDVIGVIFDGTGLGTDGAIWGGEFLVGNRKNFTRSGHLKYVKIQGGERSIKEPWRIALSYLYSIGYDAGSVIPIDEMDKLEIHLVNQALEKNINCYQTSSMGRFFDCVASLLNLRQKITYEAQGAIELENILNPDINESYNYSILCNDGTYEIDYKEIIEGILNDLHNTSTLSQIAAKFHNTVTCFSVDLVCKIKRDRGINEVVLSGGVFQNSYLLLNLVEKLKEKGFDVYYNRQIPTNDSGISIGQLAIADAKKGEW